MAKHDIPTISSEVRDRIGTRYARRLREAGRLPAVVYGHQQDPVHVSVDAEKFTDILHDGAHLLHIELDGKQESVLVKDVQWDYLGREITHADLARVDLSEEVEVEIEIILEGEPKALDEEGAVLNHPLQMLEVKCRADSIPDNITHDISELTLDDLVTAGDLALPDGVKLVTDPETAVAQITIVAELPEPEAVETDADAEPEVIGKDEEDGEGEDKEDNQ